MKNKIVVAVLFLVFVGCKNGYNRLVDNPGAIPPPGPTLVTVSCCMDNNAGVTSYPPFLPESHVLFCKQIEASVRRDEVIDGKVYLPMGVDCASGHHMIGSEYYFGKDY